MRQEMAKGRNIALKERVLAKLMLIEYFRHEAFKKLAQAQAEADGKPKLITTLESAITESKSSKAGPSTAASHSPDLEAWLSDAWLKDWLAMEPSLSGEDLRMYFYFSRDKLTPVSSAAQRLSPQAQEVLQKLLGESEALRNNAKKDAAILAPAEAGAIFEEVAERVRSTDDLSGDDSPLARLCDWTEARKELLSQLVMFVDGLQERCVPFQFVPRFVELCKSTPTEAGMWKIIERWSEQTDSPQLKKAAANRLEHRNKKRGS